MTNRDAVMSALDALRLHKLRSALTMLGIIIGVAAVIAMVAVGGGAREQVVAQIRSLGSNLLVVTPGNITAGGVRMGSGAASTLTDDSVPGTTSASTSPGSLAGAPRRNASNRARTISGSSNASIGSSGPTQRASVTTSPAVQCAEPE